jgi:adenine-specific DNA glycosylase
MSATDQALWLLKWSRDHWNDRGLPWRDSKEPLDRRALVEGLLAQTRADAVADEYLNIFDGVETASEWMDLGEVEQHHRVAALGLPTLKVRAVNGIARVLLYRDASRSILDALDAQTGIGPYTAGMVATLLGEPAAPVDCNVERVGRRVDPECAPSIWIGELIDRAIGASDGETGDFPAPYRLVSMVLDIGASMCSMVRLPECDRCPLIGTCWHSMHGRMQRSFHFEEMRGGGGDG